MPLKYMKLKQYFQLQKEMKKEARMVRTPPTKASFSIN
jgi:hypothetical protein